MDNKYLATKFHIPVWRESLVARSRLSDRLHAGLNEACKLSLISAPAGYGKTTLVVEWLQRLRAGQTQERLVAWLSLDEQDNDPVRFLAYFVTALQQVDAALGQSAQSLLEVPQTPPLRTILDEFINDIAAQEARYLLVLDDYHTLHNPELHAAMEYFVDHQPAQIHLVITTREDPLLPLSRLRVRRQMTEIRAGDLRFTEQEALRFFNQAMKLDLTSEDVSVLEARTEGWVAGLQLAALALQDLPDQQRFLEDFGGSHRYVIDYLVDEVLQRQPPEIRRFLVETSILSRFNASLCRAMTGDASTSDILAGLERANLFLIPLDDRRGWYRYHHLFADVLRAALDSETERRAHERAARWFEQHGLLAEAVRHWLAVPDTPQAARAIDMLASDLLKRGELQTLLSLLEALPEGEVLARPDLISFQAVSLLLTGQIDLARAYARRAFESINGSAGQGRLLALRAWFALTGGDPATGELSRAALAQLDEAQRFFRTLAMIALGSSLAWEAQLPASNEVFRDAYRLGLEMGHPFTALGALANLTFNLLEMGSLREAEALCRAALDEYVDGRGKPLPILALIYSPLASICYEKGDFDEAGHFAERGIDLARRLFSNQILGGDSEVVLARLSFQRGRIAQAFELLNTTMAAARRDNVAIVAYKMEVVTTELYLRLGDLAQVESHLGVLESLVPAHLPKAGQVVEHLRARYLTAAGEPEGALRILSRLEAADRREGSNQRLIYVLLSQAAAYHALRQTDRAMISVEDALRLAAPEGYRAPFFPGKHASLRPLLESAAPVAPDFVESILRRYPDAPDIPPAAARLPDPLTEQELNVLALLVEGKSNQEIADELVISLGTAKWHVHNILVKLDVDNRGQAAARAHELGLT